MLVWEVFSPHQSIIALSLALRASSPPFVSQIIESCVWSWVHFGTSGAACTLIHCELRLSFSKFYLLQFVSFGTCLLVP